MFSPVYSAESTVTGIGMVPHAYFALARSLNKMGVPLHYCHEVRCSPDYQFAGNWIGRVCVTHGSLVHLN